MGIALVFAGQGAQYSGMGRDLYDNSTAARNVFGIADTIRPGISDICFNGTAEALTQTCNTQPAVLAMDMACAESLREAGIKADCVAGFSLGEIAALSYASVIHRPDAFALICKRGEFMEECNQIYRGGMVAVLKLADDKLEALAKEYDVYPANYNCPGQISVSGLADQLDKFSQAVIAAGGRVVPLAVGGAFHSPYMRSAAEKLKTVMATINIGLASEHIPVYSNVTAKPYTNDITGLLCEQAMSPVKWQQTIENMIADGVDTFIEVGPGKVLSGLIKRISKNVTVMNVDKYSDIEMVVNNVKK